MKSERNEKEYREFTGKFQQYVEELTRDWGAKVALIWGGEAKEQGEDLLLIVMNSEKEGAHIQRFHLEEIYDDYVDGISMEDIFEEVKEMLERCREIEKASPLSHLEKYETVKKQLILRPVNYERNRVKLQEGIYERIGDIALVLYVNIGSFKGIYTSSMVPRKLLRIWEESQEAVLRAAKKNTYDLFPPKLLAGFELDWKGGADFRDFMDSFGGQEMKYTPFGTFITTENQCNGAIAIFLPGVAKRLSDLIGGDLYIAFTSMHEAVVHDTSRVNVNQIRKSIHCMNECSSEEEFLTDQVYYYSRKEDKITPAE